MGAEEEGTHERLKAHRLELVDLRIREHRGGTLRNTATIGVATADAVCCTVLPW
jgi:hypothetical protein